MESKQTGLLEEAHAPATRFWEAARELLAVAAPKAFCKMYFSKLQNVFCEVARKQVAVAVLQNGGCVYTKVFLPILVARLQVRKMHLASQI